MSQTTKSLFFRNLNPHVKQQFKTTCVRRGELMQDVIEAFMRIYSKEPSVVPLDVLKKVRAERVKRTERKGKQ